MKRNLYLILVLGLTVSLSGCLASTNQAPSSNNSEEIIEQSNSNVTNIANLSSLTSIEKLEEQIYKDVENTLNKLETQRDKLVSEINSYEQYVGNVDKVKSFYSNSIEETNQLGIRLREYSLKYAQLVLNTKNGYDDKYAELKGIYNCIYEDAGKDMYDIYDDILKEMYDIYYDGILKDAYDLFPYEEWLDVHTEEYKLWLDTSSDVYDIWLDVRSDIYDFGSDIRSEVYDRDEKRIQKKLEKFEDDIIKLKSKK